MKCPKLYYSINCKHFSYEGSLYCAATLKHLTLLLLFCVCVLLLLFFVGWVGGGGGGAACFFLTFLPHISSRDEKLDSLK